ncbi:MAG: protein kinase [Microcystaceae cyanobacterium]
MVTLLLLDPEHQHPIKQWYFPEQSCIRIGRHRDNDVVFTDSLSISRFHAEISQSNKSQWQLKSSGVNGTYVNHNLVTEADLQDNDTIRLTPHGPLLSFQLRNEDLTTTLPEEPICNHQGNDPNNLFCIHCGQPIVEKEVFIRQYQILKVLGVGGMGTTFLAWNKEDPSIKPPPLVVVKEMNADIAKIPKAQELFEREARILQSLSHEGIPKYHDFFLENGQKYLIMELIHGQNLEQYVSQQGTVSLSQAIAWTKQVCQILDYLQGLNPPLVHRDVKPANLLLTARDKRIMLIDFGAVKEVGTPPGTRIGVEGYTAPEQYRGKYSPQSDLYTIGPTLVYLLTGENPLKYYRQIKGEIYLDVSQIEQIPPNLAKVMEKACQPNPSDRYQTAQALYEALGTCLET